MQWWVSVLVLLLRNTDTGRVRQCGRRVWCASCVFLCSSLMSSWQPCLALLSDFHALKICRGWVGDAGSCTLIRPRTPLITRTLCCKLVFCYLGVGVVRLEMDGVAKLVTTSELLQSVLLPDKLSHVSRQGHLVILGSKFNNILRPQGISTYCKAVRLCVCPPPPKSVGQQLCSLCVQWYCNGVLGHGDDIDY